MKKYKTIGLVAHDNKKKDLMEWIEHNAVKLREHKLICTGTTGKMVKELLSNYRETEVEISTLKSGPLGGDQQLGSLICTGHIDILIFFTDQMTVQPHDVDVKALTRLATMYGVVMACNRSTADFVITSPLFEEDYEPIVDDYSSYLNRIQPINKV